MSQPDLIVAPQQELYKGVPIIANPHTRSSGEEAIVQSIQNKAFKVLADRIDVAGAPMLPLLTARTPAGAVLPATRDFKIPLVSGRSNTGLVLDATGGAGLFSVSTTPGTSHVLLGEAAQNNTKTDYLLYEFTLPADYTAGQNVLVTVNAQHTESGGTSLTNTLDCEAWLMTAAGAAGADICATAATAIAGTAGNIVFTLTGTTLNPGDRLTLRLTSVATEGGDAGTTRNRINSITVTAPGTFLLVMGASALYAAGRAVQNATATDVMWLEAVVPQTYVAGSALTLRVNAQHTEASGTTLTNTLDASVYEVSAAGVCGSDVCATDAQAIAGTAGNLDFTVTPTAVAPGDRLLIKLTSVATEGGNAGTTQNRINSVSLVAVTA